MEDIMADTKLENQAARELRNDEEERQEGRHTEELDQQQNVNQGMDTGTHSSTKHGVNWGRHYRTPVREEQRDQPSSGAGNKGRNTQSKKP
jgi:hypothetical protein